MARNEQSDAAPQEWKPCAPGEVRRLGAKLRGQRTRRVFLRASLATAGSILAAGGGIWLAFGRRTDREYDYGGITCSEVARLQSEYVAGTVPEPTRSKIAEHIARCPECGPHFQRLLERKYRTG